MAETNPMQDTVLCLFGNNMGHNFNIVGNCAEQIGYVVPQQVPVDLIKLCNKSPSTCVCNYQNLLEVMSHNPYAFSLDDGNTKAHVSHNSGSTFCNSMA